MTNPATALTWDLPHLQSHLQSAVDLELWTIPYYMSAMYSIRNPATEAYQLIEDIVREEMLHLQLASNIANAFGCHVRLESPQYAGQDVPHIDFALDVPNPTEIYAPYSAEIGPLDEQRMNTMCLIEYPEWSTERRPNVREDASEYGSIAEFYDAIRAGMYELRDEVRGGVNQVDEFRFFYNAFPDQAVTHDGIDGYREAVRLIDLITDQGEGESQGDTEVAPEHRNTADAIHPAWSHFRKFTAIRETSARPATHAGVPDPPPGSPGEDAQRVLVADFAAFLHTLETWFGGGSAPQFGADMAKIGGEVLTCWQRGAIPRFR